MNLSGLGERGGSKSTGATRMGRPGARCRGDEGVGREVRGVWEETQRSNDGGLLWV